MCVATDRTQIKQLAVRGETPNVSDVTEISHPARMLTLLPQSAARTADPTKDPSSRLSYATAMRQIHTGEIPGLYTLSVEEGMRQEEAERAMQEARGIDERSAAKAERDRLAQEAEYAGEEDAEERCRIMKQDDFRDTHKRGYGNRMNRS